LFGLAHAVGPHGKAVGIDLAPRMVSAAAAEAVRRGLDVELRVDDAQAPELADEAFDVVASSLVLFFLPNPGAALRAWRAGLRAHGRIGVSTFDRVTTEAWSEVDRVFAPFLPAQSSSDGDGEDPFGSDAGVERLLSDAGFSGVHTVHMTVQPRFD